MRYSILIAGLAGLVCSESAQAKCADGYFKEAQIDYPCKAEFSGFESVPGFSLGSIKSSCYGEKIFPEPSSKDGDSYKFKSIDGKKHVATVTKAGEYVTFYFEVNPRRAFRFKKEGSKCYLDSFNVYAGSKKVIVSDSDCRAILNADQQVCAGKQKEGFLTDVAMKKVGEENSLERDQVRSVVENCRYHSCKADPVTKKREPRLAASFLKPAEAKAAQTENHQNAVKGQ